MFQSLHDHSWDERMISDALYDQVLAEASRFLGPEIYRHLSPQFDDAMGRLVWSDSCQMWSLPLVFFMEHELDPPTSLKVWSVIRAASFLHVGCIKLVDWMLDMFMTQSHGFSVILLCDSWKLARSFSS